MAAARIPAILDALQKYYGTQQPAWPVDPYQFLVWWHCGYPASDAACDKGWQSLTQTVGSEPAQILAAPDSLLIAALKPGGMIPNLRAARLQELATRMQNEFAGDLTAALSCPLPQARKLLKQFPGIGDPGADRILLFAAISPIAAVPSNSPHVLLRIQSGAAGDKYTASYKAAQQALETQLPATFPARQRAYLLLKHHAQEICKRTHPKCELCPVNSLCAFPAALSH